MARAACLCTYICATLPLTIGLEQEKARRRNVAQLTPYIFFGGNCREAMTFYQEGLGGELFIQTVGDSPMAGQMPPETHNGVLHAALQGSMSIMSSDNIDGSTINIGTAITLCISGGTKDETRVL